MKAVFELQDKGSCRSFTIIRGVRRTYTFPKDRVFGTSRYYYEGDRAGFDAMMKDIYGELNFAYQRQIPIFVFPEIPETADVSALEADNKELHLALGEANEEIARLKALLNKSQNGAPSAFPAADFVPIGTLLEEAVGPALAPGSASLNPDEETSLPVVIPLTRQQKAAITRRANAQKKAETPPEPKGDKHGKGKKSSRHAV